MICFNVIVGELSSFPLYRNLAYTTNLNFPTYRIKIYGSVDAYTHTFLTSAVYSTTVYPPPPPPPLLTFAI
jgi:hypothetical protein